MSLIVDTPFVLDILIIFRTAILNDDNGDEVRDSKVVALTYIKGRFIIDFLSTVPFDSLALIFLEQKEAEQFQLFGLLKLIRVARLNKIIMYLNLKKDIKAVSKFYQN